MEKHVRERVAMLFTAMGHPTRLRILDLLLDGERSVNEIAAALNLHQSSTSQHLAVLARAGILVVTQRGAARRYRVRGPRIVRMLALMEEFCRVHSLYGDDEDTGAESPVASGSGHTSADSTSSA